MLPTFRLETNPLQTHRDRAPRHPSGLSEVVARRGSQPHQSDAEKAGATVRHHRFRTTSFYRFQPHRRFRDVSGPGSERRSSATGRGKRWDTVLIWRSGTQTERIGQGWLVIFPFSHCRLFWLYCVIFLCFMFEAATISFGKFKDDVLAMI